VPSAKLLSDRPLVEFDDDGNRVLQRTLKVDLGQALSALHRWGKHADAITMSKTGTTVLTVREGFVYNGASFWLARAFLGRRELYEAAACLHDQLAQWVAPRGASDEVFRIVSCSGRGVKNWQARAAWIGLRLGGWVAWWGHRRRQRLKRKTV